MHLHELADIITHRAKSFQAVSEEMANFKKILSALKTKINSRSIHGV